MRTIRLLAIAAFALAVPGCAHLKAANDIALELCELLGTEHPDQLRAVVDQQEPSYSARAVVEGDADAFSPAVLCAIPAIADLFLADQEAALARLSRPDAANATSGGECLAPPGGGPGAGAEAP